MIHMMHSQDYPYHHADIPDPRGEYRELSLERPLIFIDVQTTGIEVKTARIVEISTLKIEVNGEEEFRSRRVNPNAPITPDATRKHGITNDDIADEPSFSTFARGLAQYLTGCDLAGFGINRFGLRVLRREFDIAGVPFETRSVGIVDVMQVYHRLEPRNFKAAYKRYVGDEYHDDPPESPETKLNAVRAILQGQVQARDDLPLNPASIGAWATAENGPAPIDKDSKFVWSSDGEPLINFGRYRGNRLSDLCKSDADYLKWVASHESFTREQRDIAGNASEGIMPKPPYPSNT